MGVYKLTKVTKRNVATGEIVMIYPSVAVAAREEGVSESTIRHWIYRPPKGLYRFEATKKRIVRETLCWRCQKACGSCSWSHEFKPVEGWTATRKDILAPVDGGKRYRRYVESYIVHRCPEFVPDPPREKKHPWMTKKCVECASFVICETYGPICKKRRGL